MASSFLDDILEREDKEKDKENKDPKVDEKNEEVEDKDKKDEDKSKNKYMLQYCDEFYEAFKGRI